ncbi:hypothetical protein [Embleya sp. NPDC005971]|uniref:hypothetical protein n=1 Tax=Embleya sp. NPDC005971 TaxID=3156724 RepID=UPI0033DABA43
MSTAAPTSVAEMLDERRHLLEIATWLFDAAAADRILQETYRRWYALDDAERARIGPPRAWLTRVAGGICLDRLSSTASAETPVDDYAADVEAYPPRPRPDPDPVTEWLRRNPTQDHGDPDVAARHDEVVRRFAAACVTGDTAAMRAMLAADAIVVSDGGGKVRAAVEPTHGAEAVARFVKDLLGDPPHPVVSVASVNGRAGLLLGAEGRVVAVVGVSVAEGDVTAVWIMLNPDKLRGWQGGRPHPAPDRAPVAPGVSIPSGASAGAAASAASEEGATP